MSETVRMLPARIGVLINAALEVGGCVHMLSQWHLSNSTESGTMYLKNPLVMFIPIGSFPITLPPSYKHPSH